MTIEKRLDEIDRELQLLKFPQFDRVEALRVVVHQLVTSIRLEVRPLATSATREDAESFTRSLRALFK